GGGDLQKGDRCIMLDRDGNAYFGTNTGQLARWDAKSHALRVLEARLPQKESERASGALPSVRAAAGPLADGRILGVTFGGGQLFAFDPRAEKITPLGPTFGEGEYTAALALSPGGKYLYYAPGAHGSAALIGVPVVQYNVATGQRKVLAFLGDLLKERRRYAL